MSHCFGFCEGSTLSTFMLLGILAGAFGCSSKSSETTSEVGKDGGTPIVDASPKPDALGQGTNVPGKYPIRVEVEGSAREFIVYVPEKARGSAPVPAVFMFHGTSGNGEDFYGRSRWKEVADAEGILAVFPTALTYCYYDDDNHNGIIETNERTVYTKWAAGQLGQSGRPLCTEEQLSQLSPEKRALADHPLRDDVKFIDYILDYLNANYAVDTKRVFASGFSNGAEMTGRLANERSNRFAAVALAASAMSVDPVPQANPISVVFTIGSMDEEQGPRVGGNPVPLTEAEITNPAFASAYVGPMLTMLQLDKSYAYSLQSIAGKKASQFLFAKSTIGKRNTFRAVVLEDVVHEYPNGINHPIKLADVLWQFFKDQSLP